MDRQCRKCGTTKPLEEFCKSPRSKGGRDYTCGACAVVRAQKWAEKNRSRSREIKRKWREKNPDKQRASEVAYREAHRDEVNKRNRQYERDNREKKNCHRRVQVALKSGALIRPWRCPSCGKETRKVHAHHNDYSKPLDIWWLCSSCHVRLHKEIIG